ncbi:MAG: ERMES complex subunit [Pleopsidium flavum]|nr:MAG: ERMES complex subunit [Pleopsidium flavum]
MAFNFNWSPLTADASFYTRAQELLTTALNKSPKPPIIVDDIIVNELNLGSVPPDLEILEIGDLAEDRFRGIFKMCYTGDAFLTLKTRVQANPLNTYLSMKPSFASPQPLAAAAGLTIPLQITLSDIKLSAFIILVFSRQKGLTLVFRNDPLESLKVSSTFDSIPFVRDYLQKEIEGQLRVLLMEEVPAIIHRLSLRLWVPEYRAKEDEELLRDVGKPTTEEKVVDPLASPPQDPVDMLGNPLDTSQIASLSIDSGTETHSLFSQKNLLRLATLTDSHRTLSLFTPSIRDAVFRAWAGPTERGEAPGMNTPSTPMLPSLSRMHSYTGGASTTYTLSDSVSNNSLISRPTFSSFGSAATGLSLGTSRHAKPHAGRKRKNRVVNLRREKGNGDDTGSVSDGSTMSATASSAASESGESLAVIGEKEEEPFTPPRSPNNRVRFRKNQSNVECTDSPTKQRPLTPSGNHEPPDVGILKSADSPDSVTPQARRSVPVGRPTLRPYQENHPLQAYPQEKDGTESSLFARRNGQSSTSAQPLIETPAGGILEQAWMMKMAGEIARRVQDEKTAKGSFWDRADREDSPPPAYGL